MISLTTWQRLETNCHSIAETSKWQNIKTTASHRIYHLANIRTATKYTEKEKFSNSIVINCDVITDTYLIRRLRQSAIQWVCDGVAIGRYNEWQHGWAIHFAIVMCFFLFVGPNLHAHFLLSAAIVTFDNVQQQSVLANQDEKCAPFAVKWKRLMNERRKSKKRALK